MKIDWTIEYAVTPELISLMQISADRAAEEEGIEKSLCVSVLLCGNDKIQHLNKMLRGIDKVTDVLSFPSVTWSKGKTAKEQVTKLNAAYDPDDGCCFLGDIAICIPRLQEQARAFGHSEAREAAYLLVHGLFHLMGYDHIMEEDKRKMREQEEKVLSSIGILREEPDWVSDETLLNLARDAMKRSYSPYSHFSVGAAIHSLDGRVFQGCNIENASFGLTNCAERTALFKAVSEGARAFDVIAIAVQADEPAWPCGACRQALSEFAPSIRVIVTWGEGQVAESNLQQLLPHQFNLKDKE